MQGTNNFIKIFIYIIKNKQQIIIIIYRNGGVVYRGPERAPTYGDLLVALPGSGGAGSAGGGVVCIFLFYIEYIFYLLYFI